MRRYKLIKKYPESPKMGTIIYEDSLGQIIDDNICIYKDVDKYPEFWEEIKVYCTTYDGVGKYIGETVWIINYNNLKLLGEIILDSESDIRGDSISGYCWFSTKKAAVEYLRKNSKLYTEKDLEEAFNGGKDYESFNLFFKELWQ